jgi:hypothetical protein
MSSNAFAKLQRARSLRKRQVFCPIIKQNALTTPLTVDDDLTLRTMVAEPALYDQEISKLVYKHTEFPDTEHGLSFKEFNNNLSSFDRDFLLWGIFTSTYNTFGIRDIECPKCNEKWKYDIKIEELVQEDFVEKIWDKDIPFTEYSLPIEEIVDIKDEDGSVLIHKFRFNMIVPTIQRRLGVLALVPSDKLKENAEKFGSVLSKSEELTLTIKSLEIFTDTGSPPDVIDNIRDVHRAIGEYIPEQLTKSVIAKYNENFKQYVPNFKKPFGCAVCEHEFDYSINIELSLFRSFFNF